MTNRRYGIADIVTDRDLPKYAIIANRDSIGIYDKNGNEIEIIAECEIYYVEDEESK